MGRRCKTLLPIAGTLLQPRHSIERETRALTGSKRRQEFYYNKQVKPVVPGEVVRMKLPGQCNWSTGTCTKKVNERSYVIKAGNVKYRRNRKNLIQCPQEPLPDVEDSSDTTTSPTEDKTTLSAAMEWPVENAPETTESTSAEKEQTSQPRCSTRVRKTPGWHDDYAMPHKAL